VLKGESHALYVHSPHQHAALQELRASPGLAQMGAGAMAFAAATLSAGGNADVLYALSRGVGV
jgi:hypothetical protein